MEALPKSPQGLPFISRSEALQARRDPIKKLKKEIFPFRKYVTNVKAAYNIYVYIYNNNIIYIYIYIYIYMQTHIVCVCV
jgi:hypothetical protein